MTALVTACNEALALIKKGQITALTETSVEAKYCLLFSGPLLEEIADWYAWPQLIKRSTLAGTTNDRPAEWKYAYAVPADFGEPIAIRRVQDNLDYGPLVSIPYTAPEQDRDPLAFIVEGGKVYSNVEDATLVYSNSQIDISDFTPMMRRAFVDEMAARLAEPVAKLSTNKVTRLEEKAMMSKLNAIADAQNKNPSEQPHFTTMSEYAREGHLE